MIGSPAGWPGDKLYSARAVLCNGLEGAILFEPERMPSEDWWRGLLLLVLRDALEGDLAVGWGKARGYGAFRISVTVENEVVKTWAQLLDWLESSGRKSDAQTWIGSLYTKIEEIVGEMSVREECHAWPR